MLFTKRSFLAYCSALACTLSLHAADASEVSATKTSFKDSFFPGAYSSADLGVKSKSERDEKSGKRQNFKMKTSGSYTLGSTFFKDKLDLSVTLGAEVSESSSEFKNSGTSFSATYTAFKNDYYNIAATSNVGLPKTGDTKTTASFGGKHELSYKYETVAGELSASLGEKLSVSYGDEPSLAKVSQNGEGVKKASLDQKKIEELGLQTKEDDDFVYAKQEAPGVSHSITLSTKWKPSYVKGLSLSASTCFSQSLSPTVELSDDRQSVKHKTGETTGLPVYTDKNSFENTLGAKYEFDKETKWASLSFSFSDANDQGERDYTVAGSIGMKLF